MDSRPPPDGDRRPPSSSAKGKGKASETDARASNGNAGGLLSSMARSAQSAVTPEALSSLLSAGGKAVPGFETTNGISSQTFENATSSSQQHTYLPLAGATSLRSSDAANPVQRQQNEAAFQGFESSNQALTSQFEQNLHVRTPFHAHQDALVGPFDTASALDRPMHDHVRGFFSAEPDLSQAWDRAEMESAESATRHSPHLHDPSYHEAWARTVPAPLFPGNFTSTQERGAAFDSLHQQIDGLSVEDSEDFMHALHAEEIAERRAPPAQVVNGTPLSSMGSTWRPPSPSSAAMTKEQAEMHRALAQLQDSAEGTRAEERIRPPDDDAEARTGVYASNPEEALRAVWDAEGEGGRASEFVRDSREYRSTDGAEIVKRIRRLLQRGSYTDDVYGVPPALEATIKLAESSETEANRELRAKAIARLDALYRQLDVHSSPNDVNTLVGKWL